MIAERASLTKSELVRCALINRAAIKHTRRIGRNRMCGGVIVRPTDSRAYLDRQRIGLEASTGDRHCIVGTGRSRSRGNHGPLRRRRRMRSLDMLARRRVRGWLVTAQ